MDVWPSILLIIILIGINAFFAMSEIAIISINTQKMKRLAEEGNRAAARLLKITDSPSDFLATIQIGVTLSGFLNSAVAADNFAGPVAGALAFLPLPAAVLRSVVLVVITIIISYFTLILGPESLEKMKPDPEGLLKCVRETGRSRGIMVGDSYTDILAGKAAGMETCGVLYGMGNREKLLEAGADHYIEKLEKLLSLI